MAQLFSGFFTAYDPGIASVDPKYTSIHVVADLSTEINLTLDIAIFATFLAVANPGLTGMTIHERLALAFAAAIVTHLLFHWDWLVAG